MQVVGRRTPARRRVPPPRSRRRVRTPPRPPSSRGSRSGTGRARRWTGGCARRCRRRAGSRSRTRAPSAPPPRCRRPAGARARPAPGARGWRRSGPRTSVRPPGRRGAARSRGRHHDAMAPAPGIAGGREHAVDGAARPGCRRSRCCGRASAPRARRPPPARPGSRRGSRARSPGPAADGWMRGSSIASCGGRPWSTSAVTTRCSAERMRADPLEPTTASEPSGQTSSAGVIIDVRRVPGAGVVGPVRSSSPSMLFMCRPVSPTKTPEPQPVEHVMAAALPAASTTEMWVVPRGACPIATGSGAPASSRATSAAAASRRAGSSSRRAPPWRSAEASAGVRRRSASRSTTAMVRAVRASSGSLPAGTRSCTPSA